MTRGYPQVRRPLRERGSDSMRPRIALITSTPGAESLDEVQAVTVTP
jgi:hypothetical protein